MFALTYKKIHNLFLLHFLVIFAPTELKIKARVTTLNVTWHPSPNHTLVSGYKLSYREVEDSANVGRATQTHTIRLRKKARYHLLTGLGKLSCSLSGFLAVR